MPRTLLLAAIACACAPGAAWGAATPPSDGDLSPRLAELAKPVVRTAPPSQQARALSVAAEGPGSLVREGNRVLVEVRFDGGAAAGVDALRSAGAKVVDVSTRYQTVTVAAKPSELRGLSGVPRVGNVSEVLTPVTYESQCPAGVAVSEGDLQLRADEARLGPPALDGSGVKVGILSDSFDTADEAIGGGAIATKAADDVAGGDLPGAANECTGQETPVSILEDYEATNPEDPEPADEGRAMAQIVHDLAPGADISFATAFTGLTAFADNVRALAGGGAEVIVDDVFYFAEPFFQEGPVGVAVSDVSDDGVSYFSSAGNNNLIDKGRNIASWEAAQFRNAGNCPTPVVALSEEFFGGGLNANSCMDFNSGDGVDTTFGITVAPGATLNVDLQWAEPWFGVGTDLDAFLIAPGGAVTTYGIDDNPGNDRPFEFLAWENNTGGAADVQLVLNRYAGDAPRLKLALVQNGGGVTATEYPESLGGDIVGPTVFGHNGAEQAISVAAIRYSATEAPESYSSRGPVTHYFEPVLGTTPAAPLAAPKVLSKPDITATDCGRTTFFVPTGTAGLFRFCGTSAAAPHAAAVAALLLDDDELAPPEQIRAALLHSASPIGAQGPCAVGAGLVDAVGALALLRSGEPGSPPSACQPPESQPWKTIDQGGSEGPPLDLGATATPTSSTEADPLPQMSPADRTAPRTGFRRTPPKVVRSLRRRARVVFVFRSNERNVDFLCQFDRKRYRRCGARFVRFFLHGPHVLRVRARDAAGNVDPTPAVYRFRVKRGKPTRGTRGSG